MSANIIHSLRQLCDANGVPHNGAQIYVYNAGTVTPRAIYSDASLTVPADNPIICDGGYCPLVYTGAGTYKVSVFDADDVSLPEYDGDNIDPGVPVGSGDLPVADGGTGASTAAQARTNLGAAAASDVAAVQTDVAALETWAGFELTTATRVASGTTGQRPAAGTISWRYNSTTGFFEADNGTAWKNLLRQGQALPADFATGSGLFCLKRTRTAITSTQAITDVIPLDDTVPLITEGAAVTGSPFAFTPTSATSTIRVLVKVYGSLGIDTAVMALFKDGVSGAVAANAVSSATNGGDTCLTIEYEFDPGSVSAISFALRIGVTATTFTVNGADTLGAKKTSHITIEEWLAP